MKKRKMAAAAMTVLLITGVMTGCGGSETAETQVEKNGAAWLAEQMKEDMEERKESAAAEEESKSHVGEEKTVRIKKEQDLVSFRDRVNDGEVALEGILETDLDLSSLCSESVGSWEPIEQYNGTFDGGGHTISGLYIQTDGEQPVGLFGETDEEAVIQNLGVIDSAVEGVGYAGAVVGKSGGVLKNCWSDSQVFSGSGAAGGVAGFAKELTGCYNLGEVAGGTGWIGGVVGEMSGTITDCYNQGTVVGKDFYTGGVAGLIGNESHQSRQVTAINCFNQGSVRGEIYTGGVIGYAYNAWIDRCQNTGSVECPFTAGGIVGYSYGDDYEVLMTNCFNKGSVAVVWEGVKSFYEGKYVFEDQELGGLAGRFKRSGIVNCYNTGELSAVSSEASSLLVGGLVGQPFGTYSSYFYNSFAKCHINVQHENPRIDGIGSYGEQCDNTFFLEGTQKESSNLLGDGDPGNAPETFTDGTVLEALQGWPESGSKEKQEWLDRFDEFGYELSSWKAGEENPVFEWE